MLTTPAHCAHLHCNVHCMRKGWDGSDSLAALRGDAAAWTPALCANLNCKDQCVWQGWDGNRSLAALRRDAAAWTPARSVHPQCNDQVVSRRWAMSRRGVRMGSARLRLQARFLARTEHPHQGGWAGRRHSPPAGDLRGVAAKAPTTWRSTALGSVASTNARSIFCAVRGSLVGTGAGAGTGSTFVLDCRLSTVDQTTNMI